MRRPLSGTAQAPVRALACAESAPAAGLRAADGDGARAEVDAIFPLRKTPLIENRISGATLDLAAIGDALTVAHVQAPQSAPEWERWLEEIGFIAGEHVMLMARGLPGGDPLVVRIGQSTFALRRAEAACVRVVAVARAEQECPA